MHKVHRPLNRDVGLTRNMIREIFMPAKYILLPLFIAACFSGPAFAEPIQPIAPATAPDDVDSQVKAVALSALTKWATENPAEAPQILGATISGVQRDNNGYHVILMKDNSAYYPDGRVKEEGQHLAYFHVFLDEYLNVVKVTRGPDEIS